MCDNPNLNISVRGSSVPQRFWPLTVFRPWNKIVDSQAMGPQSLDTSVILFQRTSFKILSCQEMSIDEANVDQSCELCSVQGQLLASEETVEGDPIVKLMKAADAVVLPWRRKPVESTNLTDEDWHHLGGKMRELIEKEWNGKKEADGFTKLSNQKVMLDKKEKEAAEAEEEVCNVIRLEENLHFQQCP